MGLAGTINGGVGEVKGAVSSYAIAVGPPPLSLPFHAPPSHLFVLREGTHTSFPAILVIPLP